MHTFCLYYIFVLSCLCLVCLSSILFFPFQIGLTYSCQVGMWQIELINFSHLSIHLSSQPANIYSTLGVGTMQVSGASKMKLRCFLLLYREEYLSLCSWTGCFALGSPKLDLQLFFGWGIAEWASWFFPFRAQILHTWFFLFAQCDLATRLSGA